MEPCYGSHGAGCGSWALRDSYCCLPGSLRPGLLGHTSAQTAPDLGTGFGGHSSKGLPSSNMLENTTRASTRQAVLFPGVSKPLPIGWESIHAYFG